MTANTYAWLIVILGAIGFLLYLYVTARARAPLLSKAIGGLIALVCFYPSLLWGGQLSGVWSVTPEFGRLALVMTLFALIWMAVLIVVGERTNP